MNKTVTANISGVVFHIESTAYDHLHNYLNTIRNYFKDSEGKDEIMADIEARIAELFKESLDEGKEVITTENVKRVINIMGEPEQYMDEVDPEDMGGGSSSSSKKEAFYSKKLYRDVEGNILGGVCSGVGYYFGVDKIWFRAAFLIAFFGFGFGFLLYLILWIIIPGARTTAEKLEMKGEPINIDSIGNAIKDEFGNFKKKVNSGEPAKYRGKAENAIYRFFDFLGKILLFLFKFIVKVIAVLLVLIGISGLVTYLAICFGGPFNLNINNENIQSYWMSDISDLFFASDFIYSLGVLGISLVTLIPLLGILYGGLKILFEIPKTNRAVGLTAISLWAIGIIMIIIAGTSTASQYANKQIIDEEEVLNSIPSDTLILSSMESSYGRGFSLKDELYIEGESIYGNDLAVDVIRSKDNKIRLIVEKSAKGSNRREAGERAENIRYNYELDSNELRISPFIEMPLDDKFRDQDVEISIAIPIGKSIYLDASSRDIIYDIKNITNTYDGRMMSHHWKMTEKGLACTDCAWLEDKKEVLRTSERRLREEAEELRKQAAIQAEKARIVAREAEEAAAKMSESN